MMENTGAITRLALASSLVTLDPCGRSEAPGWSAGGVLLPSSFPLSGVLLYLVLFSPIFTVGEKIISRVVDVYFILGLTRWMTGYLQCRYYKTGNITA